MARLARPTGEPANNRDCVRSSSRALLVGGGSSARVAHFICCMYALDALGAAPCTFPVCIAYRINVGLDFNAHTRTHMYTHGTGCTRIICLKTRAFNLHFRPGLCDPQVCSRLGTSRAHTSSSLSSASPLPSSSSSVYRVHYSGAETSDVETSISNFQRAGSGERSCAIPHARIRAH